MIFHQGVFETAVWPALMQVSGEAAELYVATLCSFQGPARRRGHITGFGGYSEGETPLPIPNREVKPLSADGTWPARAWESRSPPVID
jgi:hypothetical protein